MTGSVPTNRYYIFVLIACAGFAVDLYSKHAIFVDLGYTNRRREPVQQGEHQQFDRDPRWEGESRLYLDGWLKFRLLTSFNEGALWGIGQGWTWLFAGLSVLAAVGVIVWLFVFKAARSCWLTVSLGLVVAGAMGNLWDRLAIHGCVNAAGDLIYGVRDFLFFTFGTYHYPIFNVADIFLVTGAIMLVLQSFFFAEPPKATPETISAEAVTEEAMPATESAKPSQS